MDENVAGARANEWQGKSMKRDMLRTTGRPTLFGFRTAITLVLIVIIMPMSVVAGSGGSAEDNRPDMRDLPSGTLTGPTASTWDTAGLPDLLDARMVILNGWYDEEGNCQHGFKLTAEGDDTTPQEARLVAIDLVNCEFQFEYGTPQYYYDPQDGSVSSAEEVVNLHGQSDFGAMSSGIRSASFQTNWFDVAGIKINHARSAVSVSYVNNTITHGNCKRNNWWLSETGWVLQTVSQYCDIFTTYGDSNTHSSYYNSPFCGGTYTHYNRTHAYATPYGSSGWVDATWAAGCLSSTLYYTTQFWPNTYF